MISVIVTVGPHPSYKKYLQECLNSIHAQEGIAELEIVIIDDAAHIVPEESPWPAYARIWKEEGRSETYYKNPWNLGQAASINIGIANAQYDLIFVMGGSDDILMSGCLQTCLKTWQDQNAKFCCVHPVIVTSEGETSTLPQGVWLFSREKVWAPLGGYPREAGIGEVDAIFCSVMLKQGVKMIQAGGEPLYHHREHPHSLTATKSYLRHDAAGLIRTMCTNEWEDPTWRKGFGYD